MIVWEGFDPWPVDGAQRVDRDVIVSPFDCKGNLSQWHGAAGGHLPSDYTAWGYSLLNTAWSPLYAADAIYATTPELIAKWRLRDFGEGRAPQPYAYWHHVPQNASVVGAEFVSFNMPERVEAGVMFGRTASAAGGAYGFVRPGARVPIMAERLWSGGATTDKSLLERTGEAYWT